MLPQSSAVRLSTQLDALPLLLDDAGPEKMRRRSPSGKWSAHENLAHLARYHQVFMERLRRILSEDKPCFPRYRAEEDPEWAQYPPLATDEVVRRLRSLRGELIELVNRLSPAELRRVGVHPAFGEMTLEQWVEFFLLHEAHHLYVVIRRLRGVD